MTTSVPPQTPSREHGPGRRRILTAAAWSVPSVALIASATAAAASGASLSFSAAVFAGPGCGTIEGATVQAVTDGSPAAGVSVALQLSGGYSFDGGATSLVVVTGGDGRAACGSIHVPAAGSDGTLSATTANTVSATATLSRADGRLVTSPRGVAAALGVPAGAVPVAGDLFLTLDGGLMRAGGTVVATGVAATGALVEGPAKNGAFLLPLRLTDGSAAVYDTADETVTIVAGVPAGATPVAADIFRSGTALYRGGVLVAADVDECGQLLEREGEPGVFELPYRSTDGTPRLYRSPADQLRTVAEYGASDGPPSGAVPVAGDLFFAAGSLYRVSWDGTSSNATGVVATGVDVWGTLTVSPVFSGQRVLPVRLASGAAALFSVEGNAVRTADAVPDGASPVGADLFLAERTVYRAVLGAVAGPVDLVGQTVPATAGATRIVLPTMTATASC